MIKRWAYFSTSGIWFQAVANGALYTGLMGLTGGEREEKDKGWSQITYDAVTGGLESYTQGMGGVGYIPQVMMNLIKGRPSSFNLPPAISKMYQVGSIGLSLVHMMLEDKSFDELNKRDKKALLQFFKKQDKIITSIKDGEPGKIIDMLLNRGVDYGDPSFETLINGKEFKLKEYITIPVKTKDKPEGGRRVLSDGDNEDGGRRVFP